MSPHVAFFLPTLEGGGAERTFVDLANDFVSRGLRVDFVLASCTGPYVDELDPRVRVTDFGTTRWPDILVQLTRYLRRERPDALMSGLDPANVVAVVASALAGTLRRCAISQRAVIRSVYRIEHPRTWHAWIALLAATYPRARVVICNSSAAANEVVHDLGVDPARCAIILNAVDTARITRLASEPLTDPWLANDAPPLLLSVGSLYARKDVGTLLRALAIVRRTRPCNLVVLGDGPERSALEALTRELGLDDCVRMPGFVVNPFPWIARADMLLSASLAEGCPNVIQQALACGTVIVATDCPGATADVLEHGRWGRLVPTRDPEAMASAILATLDDETPPDGRIRARDFDGTGTADRYLRLLLPDRSPVREPADGVMKPSTA